MHQPQENNACKQLVEFFLAQLPQNATSARSSVSIAVLPRKCQLWMVICSGETVWSPLPPWDNILGKIHTPAIWGLLGAGRDLAKLCYGQDCQLSWKTLNKAAKNNARTWKKVPNHFVYLDIPFQKVGADLFEWNNKSYLLVVEYYLKVRGDSQTL